MPGNADGRGIEIDVTAAEGDGQSGLRIVVLLLAAVRPTAASLIKWRVEGVQATVTGDNKNGVIKPGEADA